MLVDIINVVFHKETTNDQHKLIAMVDNYSADYTRIKCETTQLDDYKSRWLSAILKKDYERSYRDFIQEITGDPIVVDDISPDIVGTYKDFGFIKVQYSTITNLYTIGSKKSYIDIKKYIGYRDAKDINFHNIKNRYYDGYFAFFRNFDLEMDIVVERTND